MCYKVTLSGLYNGLHMAPSTGCMLSEEQTRDDLLIPTVLKLILLSVGFTLDSVGEMVAGNRVGHLYY